MGQAWECKLMLCNVQVLKTIPWEKVNIRVVGVEIIHAGEVFDGSREEIANLLQENGYIYKV